MAAIEFRDRVKDTTTTTGTGNITLSGSAPTGFQTFNAAFGTSVYFQYVIALSGEWEVGIGHLSASTTLVRDTVLASSNSNAAVSFSAGTKSVWCTLAASRIPQQVFQVSDLTVSSDDTLGNTDLALSVTNGGIYALEAELYTIHATSADASPQVGFGGGSATMGDVTLCGQWWSGEDGTLIQSKAAPDISTPWSFSSLSFDFVHQLCIKGRLTATSTGTFIIQWAQAASYAENTTLKKNSRLQLKRLN